MTSIKSNHTKKSQLGHIPASWDKCTVGDLVDNDIIEKPRDGNHGNLHPKTDDYVEEGIPFIRANSVHDNTLDLSVCKFLKKKQADSLNKGFSYPGDILLTHKGTVGNTTIVPKVSTDYIMLSPQVTYYRIKDKEKLNKRFLKYLFEAPKFKLVLDKLSTGGTRDYIGITKQKKLPVVLPPINEQNAISDIVFQWDKHIDLLRKIIECKKHYKKGLMQQLLSGKKRFPEFEDEPWQEVKLGNVFQRVTQKNENEEVTNVLTISAQDGLVSQTDYYDKSVASKDLSRYIVLQKGDFAYNKSYSDGYPLGAIKRLEEYESGVLSPLYICFRIDSHKLSSDFMTHFFENGGLDHEIYKIAREGARNHGLLNVSIKDFFRITFEIPQIEEQNKISEALNNAKKEIELLEQELEAVKKQKKGLMQQLLTGKTRVTNGKQS